MRRGVPGAPGASSAPPPSAVNNNLHLLSALPPSAMRPSTSSHSSSSAFAPARRAGLLRPPGGPPTMQSIPSFGAPATAAAASAAAADDLRAKIEALRRANAQLKALEEAAASAGGSKDSPCPHARPMQACVPCGHVPHAQRLPSRCCWPHALSCPRLLLHACCGCSLACREAAATAMPCIP